MDKAEIEKLRESTKCDLKTEKVRCRTYKKGKLAGQTKCYCYDVPFSRELMRIRIFEPTEALWYTMTRCGDTYCIVEDEAEGGQLLFTLNYGGYQKIEKIGFARGLPKMFKHAVGDKIDSSQLRSQNIMVNYGAMGVPKKLIDEFETIFRALLQISGEPGKAEEEKKLNERFVEIQKTMIGYFMSSHYKDYTIKQIENEWGVTLTKFEVMPKEADFQLVFDCTGNCKIP